MGKVSNDGAKASAAREIVMPKKIPKFKSDEEAARFWETHGFEDYSKDIRDAEIRFIKRPKKTVALRLDPEDIKSVEKIAEQKGLSYTSLLRIGFRMTTIIAG